MCSYLSTSHYTCVKHHKSCTFTTELHEVHVLLLAMSFECGCNNAMLQSYDNVYHILYPRGLAVYNYI